MTSVPAISSSGPLPSLSPPLAKPQGGTEAPAVALSAAAPDCDKAELKAGEAALSQMATTPLWSLDFELPSIPTPAMPARAGAGSFGSTVSAESYLTGPGAAPASARRAGSDGASDSDSEDEDDEEFNLVEFLMFPAWSLLGGAKTLKEVEKGAKDFVGGIGHGVQQMAGQIGNGVQQVAGQIGNGVQQVASQIGQGVQQVAGQVSQAVQGAVNAVGDAVSNGWKAITSFRFF